MDAEEIYQHIFQEVAHENEEKDSIQEVSKDDEVFRDQVTKQITDRDTQYTELLIHFVQLTKVRHWIKEFFKWFFCFILCLMLVSLLEKIHIMVTPFITNASKEELYNAIPLFISAIVSLASVLILIPLIITKYLFSTDEDNFITQIILHTQEHDMSGREWSAKNKKDSKIEKTNKKNNQKKKY